MGATLYAMSKAALGGLTKGLARDLGPRGITANLIHPGPIDTDMNPADGRHADGERALTALGGMARPRTSPRWWSISPAGAGATSPVPPSPSTAATRREPMAWLLLVGAGLLEIVWAMALKHAAGFTRLWPSLIGIAAAVVSFVMLSASLKILPVGTAYAVWVGVGALGVAGAGILLLGRAPRLHGCSA